MSNTTGEEALKRWVTSPRAGEYRVHDVSAAGDDHRYRPATRAEREAILRALYDERSELLRKRRLAGLSDQESDYLSEIEDEIDMWQQPEKESAVRDELWQRLDSIARRLLVQIDPE